VISYLFLPKSSCYVCSKLLIYTNLGKETAGWLLSMTADCLAARFVKSSAAIDRRYN
jgi:hypothetical protein